MTAVSAPSSAKWYVVHVYAGFEDKVSQAIYEQADQKGLRSSILDIVVPKEEVTEIRRGKKIETDKKFYPGYILIQMNLSDENWHLVKNTPKVTGFLGGGVRGRPVPLSNAEAKRMTQQIREGFAKARAMLTYEVGEQVRVIDGPFNSFTGLVEDVDEDRLRLKVSVSIFGRATPVELDFTQVEKV
jgi:transcription termination/antitermination protein NusG